MKITSPALHRRLLPGLSVREGFLRHPFDEEHGVRTSGLVAGRSLMSGHAHDRHVTAYYGVAPSVFHTLLQRWLRSRPSAPIEDTTFVDIGAGMGRAVLLASTYPFRTAVGVEFHPVLVRTARRNLTAWRKLGLARAPMKIVQADALDFPVPSGPCVAFLFNPFGAVVMRRWLRSVARSLSAVAGNLDILYVNNEQEGCFEELRNRSHGRFVRLFSGAVKRSAHDAAADRKILGNLPEGEYASAPHEDCSIWRWTPDGNPHKSNVALR